jgi:predicted RNA-binding protein with TRAM domain
MDEIPYEGTIIDVVIFKLGRGGDGLGRLDSGALAIVKGGKLHHRVKAKVVKSSDTYCIAEVIEEISEEPPPERFEGGRKATHRAPS